MPDAGSPDPNFWLDLWELAKTAGPFGTTLMMVMWFLERQERLKLRVLYDALFERALTGLNTSTAVVEKFSDLLGKRRQS